MASGKPVVEFIRELPPATAFAQWDVRPGGSSPAESIAVLDFDGGSTDEYMDFHCRLSEDYAGGGLTFKIRFSMSSATSGNVRLGIAIRRIADDAEDVDASHTYDFNEATVAVASAAGELKYATITFSDGADMDSWAAGEEAVVRFRREASDTTNDTATGDMELANIAGIET